MQILLFLYKQYCNNNYNFLEIDEVDQEISGDEDDSQEDPPHEKCSQVQPSSEEIGTFSVVSKRFLHRKLTFVIEYSQT